MRTLFIGKRFYTNRDALKERFGRIYQLPLHWSRNGSEVRLWLIDYHGTKPVVRCDDTLVVESTPVRSPSFWKHMAKNGFSGFAHRPELIVASGDPYVGMVGWLLARRHGAKFIFDVYDKYDEFSGYRRILGFDSFGFLLRHADACLFCSSALLERFRPECRNVVLVPNGVDKNRFKPLDMASSRRALNLRADAEYVGYFGSMESDRGIDELISAVEALRQTNQNIELLIGGKARLDLNLYRPGIHYLGNLPFESVPLAIASSNVICIPYRRSPFMDAGASNKIAETIACERPIVATRTPNLLANFPKQASQLDSLLAMPGDSESLARSIKLQLQRRMIVEPVEGMSWAYIARGAMRKLSEHSA